MSRSFDRKFPGVKKAGDTFTGPVQVTQIITSRSKSDSPSSVGEYTGTEGYWAHRTGTDGSFNIDNWNQGLGSVNSLKIDQAGRVLKPQQPAFSAAHHSVWAAAYSLNLVPAPGLVLFNRGNHYSSSTGRFTAPVAGLYVFSVMISSIGATASNAYLSAEIFKNGTRFHIGGYTSHTVGGYHYATGNFVVSLAAGDYVQAGCETAQAISCNGGAPYPVFTGYLLA